MSSHGRTREEERRLSIRTLIIASVGSATAALVTSHFWSAGTPIAAAATPVIVALVSELLHRPTERIARRLTTETDALPEAAGAAPPPPAEERRPRPAREAPQAGPRERAGGRAPATGPAARPARGAPEYQVYRAGGAARTSGLPWKPILATAAIAFAIAAAALTLPELIAGESLGGSDRDTTLFGGGGRDEERPAPEIQTVPEETQPTQPEPERREQTTTAPQPRTEETTPTTPQTTTAPTLRERTTPTPAPAQP